jgi:hypothetical protein
MSGQAEASAVMPMFSVPLYDRMATPTERLAARGRTGQTSSSSAPMR